MKQECLQSIDSSCVIWPSVWSPLIHASSTQVCIHLDKWLDGHWVVAKSSWSILIHVKYMFQKCMRAAGNLDSDAKSLSTKTTPLKLHLDLKATTSILCRRMYILSPLKHSVFLHMQNWYPKALCLSQYLSQLYMSSSHYKILLKLAKCTHA